MFASRIFLFVFGVLFVMIVSKFVLKNSGFILASITLSVFLFLSGNRVFVLVVV